MNKTIIKQVVGIDVSKDKFNVRFGTTDVTQTIHLISRNEFTNDMKGFKKLHTWIKKVQKKGVSLWLVIEATGVYYENLAYFLADQQYNVSVLLPNKAKNYARSIELKTKTDEVDASILCRIGLERALVNWKAPSATMKHLKSLTRELRSLRNITTKIKSRIHAYHHSYKPDKDAIRRAKKQMAFYEKQITEIEAQIHQVVATDEVLKRKVDKITCIKGIKLLTVITVLAETNCFALVENAKQLTSYAGLDVVMDQSGTRKGKTRISKKGNIRLRSALYMPAMSCRKSNDQFRAFYENIMTRNLSGKKGIIAIMRKMLILIYTLWKNDAEYDPNYKHPSLKEEVPVA